MTIAQAVAMANKANSGKVSVKEARKRIKEEIKEKAEALKAQVPVKGARSEKYNREYSFTDLLTEKGTMKKADLISEADALYVAKTGATPNARQSEHVLHAALITLKRIGAVEEVDGTLTWKLN